MNTTEQMHQKDLERIRQLRYMDDSFMTVCLADNFEGVELILRIVLGQKDIEVRSVRTQELMKNLQGRSAILDVHAIDSTGREFDVEVQRSDTNPGKYKSWNLVETLRQICYTFKRQYHNGRRIRMMTMEA